MIVDTLVQRNGDVDWIFDVRLADSFDETDQENMTEEKCKKAVFDDGDDLLSRIKEAIRRNVDDLTLDDFKFKQYVENN